MKNNLTRRCENSYVSFTDRSGDERKYCNTRMTSGAYSYVSFSNTVKISYKSSESTYSLYRGFNLYYEGN